MARSSVDGGGVLIWRQRAFLLVALATCASATMRHRDRPDTTTISRFDLPSSGEQLVPSHSFVEAGARSSSVLSTRPAARTAGHGRAQPRKRDAAASQFTIDFFCPDSTPTICQYAQDSFEAAGQHISAMLTIPTQIKVHATFKSFCGSQTALCSTNNILGSAAPSAYFPARAVPAGTLADVSNDLSSNPAAAASWFLYPQALVKQLKVDTDLEFATYDITAEFNADIRTWWFPSSGVPMTANQTDLSLVITHEFTHGLGWDTSLIPFNQIFSDQVGNRATPYVAPSLYFHGTEASPVADAWTYLTPFDALITDTSGKSVKDYLRPVQTWWPTAPAASANEPLSGDPNGIQPFISNFEASGAPFAASLSFANAITSAPRSLKIGTNTSLYTVDDTSPAGFELGSSITHLDYALYSHTQEFLMLPDDNSDRGFPLMDIVKQNGGAGVYGVQTLAIMTALGWGAGGNASAIDLVIGKNIRIGDATSAAPDMSQVQGWGVLRGAAVLVAAFLNFA
ncbi:hypothetical protein HKX48_003416 [Thoreauomyces humboldtii]|nr:hypothetical protein HKX48_003416 [Thoreauomyces humboldtii]